MTQINLLLPELLFYCHWQWERFKTAVIFTRCGDRNAMDEWMPLRCGDLCITISSPGPVPWGDPESGRQLAVKLCSSCHQVLPMTHADRSDPPSFQSIADLPSTTGISLNVFLHSNHRKMPNFLIASAVSNDVIAYILSLKQK